LDCLHGKKSKRFRDQEKRRKAVKKPRGRTPRKAAGLERHTASDHEVMRNPQAGRRIWGTRTQRIIFSEKTGDASKEKEGKNRNKLGSRTQI